MSSDAAEADQEFTTNYMLIRQGHREGWNIAPYAAKAQRAIARLEKADPEKAKTYSAMLQALTGGQAEQLTAQHEGRVVTRFGRRVKARIGWLIAAFGVAGILSGDSAALVAGVVGVVIGLVVVFLPFE